MLIPNKYEDLSKNLFSIGLDILNIIKKQRDIYSLYKELLILRSDEYELPYNQFLLTLDFLYALNLIELKGGYIIRR